MSNDIQLINFPTPLPELTEEDLLLKRAAFLGDSLDAEPDVQTEPPF